VRKNEGEGSAERPSSASHRLKCALQRRHVTLLLTPFTVEMFSGFTTSYQQPQCLPMERHRGVVAGWLEERAQAPPPPPPHQALPLLQPLQCAVCVCRQQCVERLRGTSTRRCNGYV